MQNVDKLVDYTMAT